MTFRKISCTPLSAPRLHFQSCWNTHIHASWIEATFWHSSPSFYRHICVIWWTFYGRFYFIGSSHKNGQIFDDNFCIFCCFSSLSRLGLLTVFLPSFIPCFLLRILLRTKFSSGKPSRIFWRARVLLSKPADTKRDRYSAKRSPVVKPIARYRKPE